MDRALYDPETGYYRRESHPAEGEDYITGTTHSPLLARVVANFITQHFADRTALTFYDVGCGSGAFLAAIQPHLPGWRLIGVDPHRPEYLPEGAEHLAEVEALEGVIFSYELFDALPCHCLRFRKGAWHEMMVRESDEGWVWEEGELCDPELLDYLEEYGVRGREGQIVEVNLAARNLYRKLAERVKRGIIITFDYGRRAEILYNPDFFPGGTLMAYRQHGMHRDILTDPGKQDITAAVNFTALEDAGKQNGFETLVWTTQASFLVQHGIAQVAAVMEDPVERRRVQTLFLGSMGEDIRLLIQSRG